jgi:hypothetical protein
MAHIHIHRKSEWINRFRSIPVYLNGKKAGSVSNGETLSLELPAGTNKLQAKIDWCGSPTMNLDHTTDGEIQLLLHTAKPMYWVFYLCALSLLPFYYFEYIQRPMPQALVVPALLGMLLFLYYLTIGRNHFLQLQEMEHDI